MSDPSNLMLLLALVAIVGLWLKLSAARERAVLEARRLCQQHGLQLLDETVGLRRVRLRRANGLLRAERCYGFEVSLDGHDRVSAHLWMLGNTLAGLSLPAAKPSATLAADDLSTAVATVSNVIPLRPSSRSDHRLH
ncbi:MAG: DUF3301 domain-containing protein [Rhodanobacter sp.]|nr:MAG: DUF3301 domain-containing protein [Rhodanobacter sp.]